MERGAVALGELPILAAVVAAIECVCVGHDEQDAVLSCQSQVSADACMHTPRRSRRGSSRSRPCLPSICIQTHIPTQTHPSVSRATVADSGTRTP